jgi:hypothetical protein
VLTVEEGVDVGEGRGRGMVVGEREERRGGIISRRDGMENGIGVRTGPRLRRADNN